MRGNAVTLINNIQPNNTVTVFVEQAQPLLVSDFIRMGNMWLTSVSVMVAVLTLLGAIVGVYKYINLNKWQKEVTKEAHTIAEQAGKKAGRKAAEAVRAEQHPEEWSPSRDFNTTKKKGENDEHD